jgi:hypothetical protein
MSGLLCDRIVYYKRTFNVGLGVLRMSTAHWMSVLGGFVSGTMGSSIEGADAEGKAPGDAKEAAGGGGGSANSTVRLSTVSS